MKPLKIRMTAFGPYSKTTVIDFENFDSQGLFLISGDTGSGKTTIFDGISYALFDRTSGVSRGTGSIRSDFATQDSFTEVILTFSHKEKIYKIRRYPEQLRKGKRSDKLVQQKKGVHLTMPDGKEVDSLSEVQSIIVDILGGLGYEQFKQISMIAQGEFLDLLLADNDKRNDILQRVFNTEFYKKVADSLRQKESQLRRVNEDITLSILNYISDIHHNTESEFCSHLESLIESQNVHNTEEIIEVLKQFIKEEEREGKVLKSQIEKLSKEQERLYKEEEKGVSLNRDLEEVIRVEKEQKTLIEKEPEIKKLKEKASLAQYALSNIKPYEEDKKRKEERKEQLELRIEEVKSKKEELTTKLDDAKKKYEEEKARESIREELSIVINGIEKSLEKYKRLSELEITKNEIIQKKEKNKKETEALALTEKGYKDELDKLSEEIATLQDSPIDYLKCNSNLEKEVENKNKVEKLCIDINNLFFLKDKAGNSFHSYKEKEEKYNDVNNRYEREQQAFLRGQAGILAKELKLNEPCPVCGSKEHPQPANILKEVPTEAKLEELKDKRNQALLSLQQASTTAGEDRKEYNTRLHSFIATLSEVDQKMEVSELELLKEVEDEIDLKPINERIKSYVKITNHKVGELKEELQELKIKKNKLEKNIKWQEELDFEWNKTKEELLNQKEEHLNLKNKIESILSEIRLVKEELEYDSLNQAKDIIKEKKEQLQTLKQQFKEAEDTYHKAVSNLNSISELLVENKNQYKGILEEIEKCTDTYLLKIKESPIKDEKTYHLSLLSQEEINRINKKYSDFHVEKEKNQDRLAGLKEKTKGKTKVDLEQLGEDLKEIGGQKAALEESYNHISARYSNNKGIRNKLKTLNEKRLEKNREYLNVSTLSKTANGRLEGKQKITFETYVQATYFIQIINQANKRFYEMSGKRYKLLRKEDGGKRSYTGLELNVFDTWTGKIRDVKSLSGGESFMAALSLALGFSDIIQGFAGGIEIDTLFIDEGFGTLDSNSLEQAIATLSSLTTGNRLVGIISHVDELKEKIPNQIIVKKDIGGSYIQSK